jgi:hypothetical protein
MGLFAAYVPGLNNDRQMMKMKASKQGWVWKPENTNNNGDVENGYGFGRNECK